MDRFFSFDARISPARMVIVIFGWLFLVYFLTLPLRIGGPVITVIVGMLYGAATAKLLAEAIRRRHDMGSRGSVAVALLPGSAVIIAVALLYALGTGMFIVFQVALVLVALGWAILLLPSGEPGDNRYGPPIAHVLRPAFGARRKSSGAIVSIVLTVGGGAAGYADARWIEGLQRHQTIVRHQDTAMAGSSTAHTELETIIKTAWPRPQGVST